MNHFAFCEWLRGYLAEKSGNGLTAQEVATISEQLNRIATVSFQVPVDVGHERISLGGNPFPLENHIEFKL